MPTAVYDVIKNKKEWKSHGAVTFAHLDITDDLSGEEARAGYYPCSGVVFKPEPQEVPYTVKPVFSWEPADDRVQERLPHPVNRVRRSMKFKVVNPSEDDVNVVRARVKDYPGFAPQARIEETFRGLFEALVFTEYSADLLVSTPLYLPERRLINRAGEDRGSDGKKHVLVFLISYYIDEHNEIAMLQRAIWDDGAYEALYGCC